MKKLLLILAIGSFVACNDSATSTDTAIDSTGDTQVDSMGAMSDTTGISMDTTSNMMVDTTKSDTLK